MPASVTSPECILYGSTGMRSGLDPVMILEEFSDLRLLELLVAEIKTLPPDQHLQQRRKGETYLYRLKTESTRQWQRDYWLQFMAVALVGSEPGRGYYLRFPDPTRLGISWCRQCEKEDLRSEHSVWIPDSELCIPCAYGDDAKFLTDPQRVRAWLQQHYQAAVP